MAVGQSDDIGIGALAKRVRLEKRVRTSDGAGGETTTSALRDVVWAAIEPMSFREQIAASALQSQLSTVVTVWYRTDIAVTDRILHMGRTFQVQSIQDPTGSQIVLQLMCEEVQS